MRVRIPRLRTHTGLPTATLTTRTESPWRSGLTQQRKGSGRGFQRGGEAWERGGSICSLALLATGELTDGSVSQSEGTSIITIGPRARRAPQTRRGLPLLAFQLGGWQGHWLLCQTPADPPERIQGWEQIGCGRRQEL